MHHNPNFNHLTIKQRGLGKTSTLYRVTRNEFRSEWDPTTEDTFEKAIKIDDTSVIFQIENAYTRFPT